MNRIESVGLLGTLVIGLGLGCGAFPARPEEARSRAILGEAPAPRKVVGWRLVERPSGDVDPGLWSSGDGQMPTESRLLLFDPVFEDSPPEDFTVRLEFPDTERDSRIILRLLGARTRSIGEPATLEGRIEGAPGKVYEFELGPTRAGIEILEVRGAARVGAGAGRYRIPAGSIFEVVFTSKITGQGAVQAWILREREAGDLIRPGLSPSLRSDPEASPRLRRSPP